MIFPIFLLALGLGAIVTYELSPKAHAWVQVHVQAVRDALSAHDAADDHLQDAAQIASTPAAMQGGWIEQARAVRDRISAAHGATSAAAQSAAQAAATAQTPVQRAVATWTAALTIAKQDQVKAFTAYHDAASAQDRAIAQHQFDDANARASRAKIELSKLGVNL